MMITLLAVLVVAVLVALAAFLYQARTRRQRAEAIRHKSTERERHVSITQKASQTIVPASNRGGQQLADDLSESGAISISHEIERCLQAESWDKAEMWAQHAIESRPDKLELKIKLAEVYCRAGMRDEFTALFEEINPTLPKDSELAAELTRMARSVIPGHSLIVDID